MYNHFTLIQNRCEGMIHVNAMPLPVALAIFNSAYLNLTNIHRQNICQNPKIFSESEDVDVIIKCRSSL